MRYVDDALARPAGTAALLVICLAGAAIAIALVAEHFFGLVPCPLCLEQRWPYYIGIPLAAVALFAAGLSRFGGPSRAMMLVVAVVFAYSAYLGLYHAGIEWGWWAQPTDCAAAGTAAPSSASDLMSAMRETRIVPCDEPAWRLFGLSFAGWNLVVSLVLVWLSLWGAMTRRPAAG